MQLFSVRRARTSGVVQRHAAFWLVLANTPEEALEVVKVDGQADPTWQLEVGQSAPTSARGAPRIVELLGVTGETNGGSEGRTGSAKEGVFQIPPTQGQNTGSRSEPLGLPVPERLPVPLRRTVLHLRDQPSSLRKKP